MGKNAYVQCEPLWKLQNSLWVEFLEVPPVDGLVENAPFRLGEHVCPLVQTIGDDVGTALEGDKFVRVGVLAFCSVKSEDEVLE